MHAGKIESSRRLQATLAALQTGPKTTRELSEITGSEAVHSDIAAIRARLGKERVPPAEYVCMTDAGNKVYRYALAEEGWVL